MSDELADAVMAVVRRLRALCEADVLAALSVHLDNRRPPSTQPAGVAPLPLEWHPWYRGKTGLLDWLESDDRVVRVPVSRARTSAFGPASIAPGELSFFIATLTKRRAVAPAPYVGDPFAYVWHVGTDQHGRSIAGDARIVHLERG